MISPPARVTRPTIVNGLIVSFRKWTEPSANRRFAPPGWNEKISLLEVQFITQVPPFPRMPLADEPFQVGI